MSNKTLLWISSFKSWKIDTLSSKSIQTEKAKFSHFDRTRGDKNQIFPTLATIHESYQFLYKKYVAEGDKVVNENFITAEELKKKHEKRKKKQKEKRDKNKAMDVEGVADMKLKGRKAR